MERVTCSSRNQGRDFFISFVRFTSRLCCFLVEEATAFLQKSMTAPVASHSNVTPFNYVSNFVRLVHVVVELWRCRSYSSCPTVVPFTWSACNRSTSLITVADCSSEFTAVSSAQRVTRDKMIYFPAEHRLWYSMHPQQNVIQRSYINVEYRSSHSPVWKNPSP